MKDTYMQKKRRRERKIRAIKCTGILVLVLLTVFVTAMVSSMFHDSQIVSLEEQHDEAIEQLNKELKEVEKRNPEYITVLVESEPLGPNAFSHIQLNMDVLMQQPELPAGCEATSLTACMNYLGFDVDKVTMARLMPQGPIGSTDPDVAFIGNPEKRGSYGCNAPVVVQTANEWLEKNTDTSMRAYDLTGHEFEDLLCYVEKGYPVIIWGTEYMNPPSRTTTWEIDGKDVVWHHGFHCLALIGWNEDGYIIMDPMIGIKTYPREDVHDSYAILGKQAVVIQPNDVKEEQK